MKKVLSVVLMGSIAAGAAAQQANALQESKFFDNWSIGLNVGAATPLTHSAFWGNMRPQVGIELTKQITPVFGLGFQGTAGVNMLNTYPYEETSCTAFDITNVSVLAKINMSNLFCGYNGVPRLFEVEAVAGAGWIHKYWHGDRPGDDNAFSTKYGLNFNFNLGEKKAWTVAFKPAIVWDMDDMPRGVDYDANKAYVELMAGVTYHFKNSNGTHYFKKVRAYDQAEVDGLNAKINDLRSSLRDAKGQVERSNGEIRNLQRQLNDCRNSKSTQTVKGADGLESVVSFRQGKTVVDATQHANIERFASYMKDNPDAKAVIKGYASPEGGAAINKKLAQKRADVVKSILVKKYGIDADRIKAEGQGVGSIFSEPEWNRVSICTLEIQ